MITLVEFLVYEAFRSSDSHRCIVKSAAQNHGPQFIDEEREVQKRLNSPSYRESKSKLTL